MDGRIIPRTGLPHTPFFSARFSMSSEDRPLVSVIMGSKSDWETLGHTDEMLTRFGVPHECLIVSAHRTPDWMAEFAPGAEGRSIQVIIAAADGAAHLPDMVAGHTQVLVVGVPLGPQVLNGVDSLLSI